MTLLTRAGGYWDSNMGTLTITTTTQHDQRISAAFGHLLGLEGGASAAQVKQLIIAYIRLTCHDYERSQHGRAFVLNPLDPT